jgi:Tol biopolymer transport system component
LDERSGSQALQLYADLSHEEKLALFTGLSDPQNIAAELVIVIEAVYQSNTNSPAGNELLNAMQTVLGRIGAAGAPSLKTEIEFWLKGREEADESQNAATAASFYDSALAESLARGHPNAAIRFDRALALIVLEDYAAALADLQAAWAQSPERQSEIRLAIQASPGLSAYILQHPVESPAFLGFITPEAPTSVAQIIATSTLGTIASASPSPLADNPAPSPFAGWIAFGYGEQNSREIMIMDPAADSLRQITNNATLEEGPSFSPDNWRLVYASYRSQSSWELYAYDLRRGTEQQLTSFEGEAHFPAWSPVPGDTRIVFEGRAFEPQRATNIWLLDVASGEVTQLTRGGSDTRPNWSPNGTKILFGRATKDTSGDGIITVSDAADIYVLDLASGEETNLTSTPDANDFNFAWSPDGQWIVFTSVRRDVNEDGAINLNDSENLFMIPASGGEERTLDMRGLPVFSPSWSPDGRFILLLVVEGPGQNALWRFDTWTEALVRITEVGPYYHPRYSNAP